MSKSQHPKQRKRSFINEEAINRIKANQRKLPTVEQFVKGIQNNNRVLLSQAITLIESKRPDHQQLAQQVIEQCLPNTVESIRIGITGTPGVGKSTFIEAFGQLLLEKGRRVAVLAVDPSSQVSQGSILGDKTRMASLSTDSRAFIRPSAAGGSLGGVARKTRETIVLLEAAGFDTILIETVGVGQSEVAVYSMVDFFLLLLLPGAGDELQGIKRGIVEMADLLVVNKADGDNLILAKQSRQAYKNAVHLFPPKESGWVPRVRLCSALNDEGLTEIWTAVEAYEQELKSSGYWEQSRREQAAYWLTETVQRLLGERFYSDKAVKDQLKTLEADVLAGRMLPFAAATKLVRLFVGKP